MEVLYKLRKQRPDVFNKLEGKNVSAYDVESK